MPKRSWKARYALERYSNWYLPAPSRHRASDSSQTATRPTLAAEGHQDRTMSQMYSPVARLLGRHLGNANRGRGSRSIKEDQYHFLPLALRDKCLPRILLIEAADSLRYYWHRAPLLGPRLGFVSGPQTTGVHRQLWGSAFLRNLHSEFLTKRIPRGNGGKRPSDKAIRIRPRGLQKRPRRGYSKCQVSAIVLHIRPQGPTGGERGRSAPNERGMFTKKGTGTSPAYLALRSDAPILDSGLKA